MCGCGGVYACVWERNLCVCCVCVCGGGRGVGGGLCVRVCVCRKGEVLLGLPVYCLVPRGHYTTHVLMCQFWFQT